MVDLNLETVLYLAFGVSVVITAYIWWLSARRQRGPTPKKATSPGQTKSDPTPALRTGNKSPVIKSSAPRSALETAPKENDGIDTKEETPSKAAHDKSRKGKWKKRFDRERDGEHIGREWRGWW